MVIVGASASMEIYRTREVRGACPLVSWLGASAKRKETSALRQPPDFQSPASGLDIQRSRATFSKDRDLKSIRSRPSTCTQILGMWTAVVRRVHAPACSTQTGHAERKLLRSSAAAFRPRPLPASARPRQVAILVTCFRGASFVRQVRQEEWKWVLQTRVLLGRVGHSASFFDPEERWRRQSAGCCGW